MLAVLVVIHPVMGVMARLRHVRIVLWITSPMLRSARNALLAPTVPKEILAVCPAMNHVRGVQDLPLIVSIVQLTTSPMVSFAKPVLVQLSVLLEIPHAAAVIVLVSRAQSLLQSVQPVLTITNFPQLQPVFHAELMSTGQEAHLYVQLVSLLAKNVQPQPLLAIAVYTTISSQQLCAILAQVVPIYLMIQSLQFVLVVIRVVSHVVSSQPIVQPVLTITIFPQLQPVFHAELMSTALEVQQLVILAFLHVDNAMAQLPHVQLA